MTSADHGQMPAAVVNGVHAPSDATVRLLDGNVIPLGGIEPPRGEELTSRLATVLRVLARATAEACRIDRCSIFVPRGDVLRPVMSQFAGGTPRPELWEAFKALETKVQLEACHCGRGARSTASPRG